MEIGSRGSPPPRGFHPHRPERQQPCGEQRHANESPRPSHRARARNRTYRSGSITELQSILFARRALRRGYQCKANSRSGPRAFGRPRPDHQNRSEPAHPKPRSRYSARNVPSQIPERQRTARSGSQALSRPAPIAKTAPRQRIRDGGPGTAHPASHREISAQRRKLDQATDTRPPTIRSPKPERANASETEDPIQRTQRLIADIRARGRSVDAQVIRPRSRRPGPRTGAGSVATTRCRSSW